MKEEGPPKSPPRGEKITHSLEEWGKPLQDFMEEKRTPVELMAWVRDLIPELDSPFQSSCFYSVSWRRGYQQRKLRWPRSHPSYSPRGSLWYESFCLDGIHRSWIGLLPWWRCSTVMH